MKMLKKKDVNNWEKKLKPERIGENYIAPDLTASQKLLKKTVECGETLVSIVSNQNC